MSDVVDASFIGSQDLNNNSLPYEPSRIPDQVDISFEESEKPVKLVGTSGNAENEWMFRQILYRGFLIAKGCQASAVLSGLGTQTVQRNCFELAKHLFLSWQAFVELKSFSGNVPIEEFNVKLISAPVLFHLSHEPSLHKQICDESQSREGLDHESLYIKVLNGPGVTETEKLLEKLKARTHSELLNFPPSDEKKEIENILKEF
jgi:geranylgeranyl pyrophosphate synthase